MSNGDGNKDGKNQVVILAKQQFLHVHHAFLYIFAVVVRSETKDFVVCLPVRFFFRDVTKTVNGDRGTAMGKGKMKNGNKP